MGKNSFLSTFRQPSISYAEFILADREKKRMQTQALVSLLDLNNFYVEHGISDNSLSDEGEYSNKNSVDWAFELFMMRRAIISGRSHPLNKSITPLFTRQANQVFILAILKGHLPIVSFFLASHLVNINQGIFKSRFWPSYYLLACAVSPPVTQEFNKYWIKQSIGWCGLTSSMLLGLASNTSPKYSYLDFMTYRQYQYLNEFRGVSLAASSRPLPIFLLDFACMLGDSQLIKSTLDAVPEAGTLSRLSFIVQNEEHIILILSRYGYRTDQSFNGATPLHYSCYCNDFCILSIQLYIGFPIMQDSAGKFPNEMGPRKMREKASIFFNLCAGVPQALVRNGPPVRIFSKKHFIENMQLWMDVLKYNPKEFDKYTGIFRYLDFNIRNKILRRSRFNIISVFSLAKSPVSVERTIQKLAGVDAPRRKYSDAEAMGLYSQYYDCR